jgi:hypothetical protein
VNDTNNDHIQHTVREAPLKLHVTGSGPDWRIWLGLSITTTWLLLLSLYIANSVGWSNIGNQPIQTLGNFLQKKELMQNTDAIKMQYVEIQKSAEQSVFQTEAIRASEMHARKQSFLQIAESVKQQLGIIGAFLFVSSQGGAGDNGLVSEERISELWRSLNNTDPEVFSRSLLHMRFAKAERYAYKLLFGTEIRTRHSESFIFNFERLLKHANDADSDGLIRDAILGGANGRVYMWMNLYKETPPTGFTYGVYDFDPDTTD